MRREDTLSAYVLIEVVGPTADRALIDRGVIYPRRHNLSVGPKIRVPKKDIDSRRVKPHRGGCAGCLRTQTCNSKTDCTCSQYEPAYITKRAINHSNSSTQSLTFSRAFILGIVFFVRFFTAYFSC